MKNLLTILFLLITGAVSAQVKISEMPSLSGNPAGAYFPAVKNGINYKVAASSLGYTKVDTIYNRNDSIFGSKSGQEFFVALITAVTDTSIFNPVIDTTLQEWRRLLFPDVEGHITSSPYLLFQDTGYKVSIGTTNPAAGGANTKLYVHGNTRIRSGLFVNTYIAGEATDSIVTWDAVSKRYRMRDANYYTGVSAAIDSLRNNAGDLEGRKNGEWVPQFTLPTAGSGSFTQADTIVYLSKSAGIVSDANISDGSSTYGTNNTTPIQNVLNLASHTQSLKVIWDVKVSTTGWTINPNTEIEVLPGMGAILRASSNTPMFVNADTVFTGAPTDSNISIRGGLWNGNSSNQTAVGTPSRGATNVFSFYGVKNLFVRDFTIINQRAYAIHGANVKNFIFENGIVNGRGTSGYNGDGVHADGGSENGLIRNLKLSRLNDDAIGLNADDVYRATSLTGAGCHCLGTYYFNASGPISNIRIENINLDSSKFGIRLLSGSSRINNIVIKNLSGNTLAYAVIIDNFQQIPDSVTFAGAGNIGFVQIENVSTNITGTASFSYSSVIDVGCNIEKLIIKDIKRQYSTASIPTILVSGANTVVRSLVIDGYDAYDTSSSNVRHININASTVNSLTVSRANVKRRGTSNASYLIYNNGQVPKININGVVADSIESVYIHPAGLVSAIVATNVVHIPGAGTAAFATSIADSLFLSNFKGGTSTSGTFAVKIGDAFTFGYANTFNNIVTTKSDGASGTSYYTGGSTLIGAVEAYSGSYITSSFQNSFGLTSYVNNSGNIQFQTTVSGTTSTKFKINNDGTFKVNNAYTMPNATGAQYTMLQMDNSNAATWQIPTRIGIGVSPTNPLTVQAAATGIVKITNTAANSYADINVYNSAGGYGQIAKLGTSYVGYRNLLAGNLGIYTSTGDMAFLNDNATGNFNWAINSATPSMTLSTTGLLVGTTSAAASAIVNITSTTQGFLPPRMTATQASAIPSPNEGLLVYVTDTNGTFTAKGWWGYDGAAWQKLNN